MDVAFLKLEMYMTSLCIRFSTQFDVRQIRCVIGSRNTLCKSEIISRLCQLAWDKGLMSPLQAQIHVDTTYFQGQMY